MAMIRTQKIAMRHYDEFLYSNDMKMKNKTSIQSYKSDIVKRVSENKQTHCAVYQNNYQKFPSRKTLIRSSG